MMPGVQLTWSWLAIARCRLPSPKCENPTPQHLNSEPTGPWMVLWPRAPTVQWLPPSQSLGTMHFARRFQSTPWVTGAEACWHLSPLRQTGKLRPRGSTWEEELNIQSHIGREWILGEILPSPHTPLLACLEVYKEGDPCWKGTLIIKIIWLIFMEHCYGVVTW